jgi:phosphatidylinositol alpha-1,6-mannosyltransferase
MSRTLVVTNDFPPRPGGIQAYVHSLASRLPADSVVVYTSTWRGAATFDREQPFPVVRAPTSVLLPTPRTARQAAEIARAEDCASVWFGAAAPLGLLTPSLRRAGVSRAVASTHGHEAGWTMVPGGRQALRRIAGEVDVITYVSEYTRSRIAPALGRHAHRLVRLAPGVDTDVFHPDCGGALVRRRLGLERRKVVVCVSRLMPRKGQDVLLRALPAVAKSVPDVSLLLVGGGPNRDRLGRLADDLHVADRTVFVGSVPWAELPAHHDAGDVFAMPCRTRLGGLDVEGLGIVFLEASATGRPVVAGRSGGAAEAVLDGVTGSVVDGRDVAAVAEALTTYLTDTELSARTGAMGRNWVESGWRWDLRAAQLARLLAVA